MYYMKSSGLSAMERQGGVLSGCQPLVRRVSGCLGGGFCTTDFSFSFVFFWAGNWVGVDPDGWGTGVLSLFKDPGHCAKAEYPATNDLAGVCLEEVV